MSVLRFFVSFIAGSLIVLTMLVAGLTVFNNRQDTPGAQPESFKVEYLTPQEAARLLGDGMPAQDRKRAASSADPDGN